MSAFVILHCGENRNRSKPRNRKYFRRIECCWAIAPAPRTSHLFVKTRRYGGKNNNAVYGMHKLKDLLVLRITLGNERSPHSTTLGVPSEYTGTMEFRECLSAYPLLLQKMTVYNSDFHRDLKGHIPCLTNLL